ncbi:MAG: NF038143 family protein [Thermodesulfobacteriota bacterium]
MASNDEKKKFILDYERRFAAQLGRAIMDKPKLSSWMVLIPFIFIFYFQDLSKYKTGRRKFSESYLHSRTKALQEAEAALAEHREHDTLAIAGQAELSAKAREKYGELLAALVDHYSSLLQADGDSYEELLQAAYGRKKNYLTYLDQLATIEKALNKALKPDLDESVEDAKDIVSAIEKHSVLIRRTGAKELFT